METAIICLYELFNSISATILNMLPETTALKTGPSGLSCMKASHLNTLEYFCTSKPSLPNSMLHNCDFE